jgi:hypothetical protein
MAFRIEDGKGSGRFAGVDDENRLEVAATQRSIISGKSEVGDAYVFYTKKTILTGSTNEQLFHIKNSGAERNAHIDSITFSTTGNTMKFELFFDTSHNSGGFDLTALNLNRSSGKTSDVTGHDNRNDDLSVNVDSTLEFADVRLAASGSATFTLTFNDAFILGPGDEFSCQVEGSEAGGKARAEIRFYEETE